MAKRKPLADGAVYTLVYHLVSTMLAENNIDTESARKLHIEDFQGWLVDRWQKSGSTTLFPDKDEIQEQFEITDYDFELVHRLVAHPHRFIGLMLSWWPKLVIREAPPRHKIRGICLTLSIEYEPEKEGDAPRAFHLPVVVYYPENTDVPFNTANVMTLWQLQLNQMRDMLAEHGTDGLFEKYCSQPVGTATDISHAVVAARPGGFGF